MQCTFTTPFYALTSPTHHSSWGTLWGEEVGVMQAYLPHLMSMPLSLCVLLCIGSSCRLLGSLHPYTYVPLYLCGYLPFCTSHLYAVLSLQPLLSII